MPNYPADLDAGYVVVVAGFQGVDADGNITTLGRGGSDTTGVALAAALRLMNARSIPMWMAFTQPTHGLCREARRLKSITFEEMLEMASSGFQSIANSLCRICR